VKGAAPVIAIDGPSGVGKGTMARALARRLGWHFLDSGALYRILALAARDAGVRLEDAAAVAALAPSLAIRFAVGEEDRIELNGRDVTAEVRAETTGSLASVVAALPAVRAALLARQRDFRRPPGLVADGRDMGTVVFPDAPVKVFLEATPEERARRRLRQLVQGGQLREDEQNVKLSSLCAEIRERDLRDRNRTHSPLKAAADAVVIDTTQLPPDAVLKRIEELIMAQGFATKP